MSKEKTENGKMVTHALKEKDKFIEELQKKIEGLDYSIDLFIAILVKENLLIKYFDDEGNLFPEYHTTL